MAGREAQDASNDNASARHHKKDLSMMRNIVPSRKVPINITIAILLAALPCFSQAEMSSGDVKGIVTDSTGAVVVGARLTVTHIATGVERATDSDNQGAFRFLVLTPGAYEMKVQFPGFGVYTRGPVQVRIGETVSVDPILYPASVQAELCVPATAAEIDTEKTQQSDTIGAELIQSLPINERNFLNFSLLMPGITDSRALISFSLPQAANSGLSFLGQNGRANHVS